jgi:hypothetical protein
MCLERKRKKSEAALTARCVLSIFAIYSKSGIEKCTYFK